VKGDPAVGYYVLIVPCAACGAIFSCNPERVPSIRIRGAREAICRNCAERWNQLHPDAGNCILPGAYDPIAEDGSDLSGWEEPEEP
jgi:hypothetical protein